MKKSIIILTLLLLTIAVNTCLAQLLDMDNTRINSDIGVAAQYNESAVINHQNPDNAMIVWQDMRSGYPRIGVAYTFDGGAIWNEYLPDLQAYPSQSEPSAAADTDGNFYVCMIGQDTSVQSIGDIIVLRSSDGGISWSNPMIAVEGSPDYNDVMPKIAVDNTSFGSYGFIYVTWVRYSDDISLSLVYSTQSSDNGRTFLAPVQVSDGRGTMWPAITVVSHYDNGDVFLCWFRQYPRGLYWDYSNTEGWNFNADLRITTSGLNNWDINGGIVISTEPVFISDNYMDSYGFQHSYLVYSDSSNTDLDIFCISFYTDGNYLTYSNPIRINDDALYNGIDQFMPAAAVDELGTIHVIFFDRRNDANNLLYDLYYTSSSDLGYTWTPNVRITNVSSDPSQPGVAGQIGDRIGIAAWGGKVVITWTDVRNGNTDIYASRMIESGITEESAPVPVDISLDNLYPNPFNSSLEIKYFSNLARRVRIDVVDLLGREVADIFEGPCQTGSNSLTWNGLNSNGQSVGSGVYFVRLTVANRTILKKAVLLK